MTPLSPALGALRASIRETTQIAQEVARQFETRPRGADAHEGDYVRLLAPLWRGWYGVVVYVGADRVEVELSGGAVVPFLPHELEPADGPARA